MKHTHALLGFATVLFATGLGGSAHADTPFGEDGQLILSGERLFGFSYSTTTTESSGTKATESTTALSLMWPGPSLGPTPYEIARAAFDVVVGSGVTLGGSIGFATFSGSTKTEAGGQSQTRDDPTLTLFALAPRVGYVLPLSDTFAFWPRVGITYYSIRASTELTAAGVTSTTKTTTDGVGLDLEPAFVYTPVSHFGILIGPAADIALSGKQSVEVSSRPSNVPDTKEKFNSFGVHLGLLGYF